MRPIGIVRKVDQLGRIVMPKSLRKNFNMNEGDPIEILVLGDHIILEKYKPKCVFCYSSEKVNEYRERYICQSCVADMKGFQDQGGI